MACGGSLRGIDQVVIYLKRTSSPLVFEDCFRFERTMHSYRVIRLWETERLEALLDFTSLSQVEDWLAGNR